MNSTPSSPCPTPATPARPGPRLGAGEQRLLRLPEGSELRCLSGQLLIEHPACGLRRLQPGQGWRCPGPDWVRLSAAPQAPVQMHLSLPPEPASTPEKSRSGLAGWERLWTAWTAPWAR